MFRPSIFGQAGWSEYGLILILLITCCSVLINNRSLYDISIDRNVLLVFLVVLLFYVVQIIAYIFNGSDFSYIIDLISTAVKTVTLILGFYLIFDTEKSRDLALTTFVNVIAVLILFSIAAFTLNFFLPYDSLVFYQLNRGSKIGSSVDFVFPVATTWGFVDIFGVKAPRFTNLFGEPGLFQVIGVWSFCYLKVQGKTKSTFERLRLIVLVIGLILSFSTAAMLSFALVLSSTIYKKMTINPVKIALYLFPILLTLVVTYYLPNYGLKEKLTNENRNTFRVRYETTISTFESDIGFFGLAFRQDRTGSNLGNDTITLIAKIKYIGYLGAISYLFMIISVPFVNKSDLSAYIYCTIPIVFTSLTSQPIDSYPLILFLFTIRYRWLENDPSPPLSNDTNQLPHGI